MTTIDAARGFDPEESISGARRALIMSALFVSTVLASLDSSFVPIALTDMIEDLDSSTAQVVWVALGYLIAATGPMLFFARLGEAVGQVRFFQIGTTIYALAMAACAWAPSLEYLVALRVIQGFGMAMFLPFTFAIASEIFPPNQRGRALGILQSANALGFLFGPIFAGFLLDAFDWRAIFSSRIPFAAFAVAIAFFAFGGRASFVPLKKRAHYDITGAVFLTVAIFGILYGLNRLPVEDNHLEGMVWLVFFVGIAFFVLFLQQERLSPDPLVDLTLFENSPGFAKSSLAFGALFASFPVYLFIWPMLLLMGMEIPAWEVGLILCASAFVTTIISPFAGKLADEVGAEVLCLIGTVIAAIGYLSLLMVKIDSSYTTLLIPMALIGLGTGLFFSPNNSLIMGSVPPERANMASGLIGTLRQSGYAVGFAVIASLFTAIQDRYEETITSFAVEILDQSSAHKAAILFDNGGIWSPEILLYIFHLTVVICTAVLVLTFVNSIPRLKMTLNRQVLTLAATIGAAVFGAMIYTNMSELTPGTPSGRMASAADMQTRGVAPFGWAQRHVEIREPAADQITGETVYIDNCAACHGADARGIEGLGLDLVASRFMARLSDEDLIAFIRTGRMEDDPENVTGQIMPPIDYLEDGEYKVLVHYLRQVNKAE